MFTVVGLTLDDVWAGSLPQVRLADALKTRKTPDNSHRDAKQPIVIYTTDPGDTQGPITRSKYKGKGTFVTILYFNNAAVAACDELKIPLRILDHVEESGLPARKVIAFEYPLAPATA
jgi:hypothetical protein